MKWILSIVILICCVGSRAQHLSNYSQYMFNGLLLNPAYAGSQEALNITALYRRQWLGLDGAPTTMNLSAHMPFKRKKAAIGFLLTNDRFGVSEHTRGTLAYAYRLRLGKGKLSLGVQGGVDMIQSNWGQIKTTQEKDPSFGVVSQRQVLPQVGCGAFYYARSFYAGVSVPELLNTENQEFQTLAFTSGVVLNVGGSVKIKPVVLIRHIRNSPLDINGSATFYWKDVVGLGAGYSVNRTAFAYIDLKITDQFRFGYSYDYSFTALRNYNSGSHEIMLRYLFEYEIQAPSIRYF